MKAQRLAAVVVAMFAAVALSGCSYNKFTAQEQSIKSSWSEVENQLQRRHDLIPNLVETVKGYAKQEAEIFEAVAQARGALAGAVSSGNLGQMSSASTQLNGALGRLLAISESYPQLKSNDPNVAVMTPQIEAIEHRWVPPS